MFHTFVYLTLACYGIGFILLYPTFLKFVKSVNWLNGFLVSLYFAAIVLFLVISFIKSWEERIIDNKQIAIIITLFVMLKPAIESAKEWKTKKLRRIELIGIGLIVVFLWISSFIYGGNNKDPYDWFQRVENLCLFVGMVYSTWPIARYYYRSEVKGDKTAAL